jgi:PAS domain S-box-containing protein
MDDRNKTKHQLLKELATLRQQVAELQASDTAHERTEAALHVARLDAESIVATVHEPLVVLDGDCRVITANRAFYQTFQVMPEATEHHLLYDLGNRQWDIPALRHRLENVLLTSTAVQDFEVTHEFPTIGQKTILLNARRIDRGGSRAPLLLLAMEDITERKRAERLLQQDHDWLDVTLASIGDAVLATDTAAAITFLNPEAERLTGWTAQDARGREIDEVLVLISQDTRQPVENPVNRVLREGTIVGMATRTMLKTRDGREIPVADSGAPIRSSDGTLHGVVMVFRDITPRYEAEQELQAAKEEAEAASRTKSEFLATMGHELRTPLSIVLGYTDLLTQGIFGPVREQEVSALRLIQRNAFELLDLITAILDLSRLEAGRLPLEVNEIQVPALLEEIKADTQGVWERSKLAVVWKVEDNLPSLRTDPGKVKMVIKNLIGNAVKFTEQGSIAVEAHGHRGGVEISVSDTGIGIAPEELRNIFEPFLQVERSTTRRYEGIGLGLHIVKRLLEMLGGTVEVKSEVGHGSTFCVWLPNDRDPTTSQLDSGSDPRAPKSTAGPSGQSSRPSSRDDGK